MKLRRLVPFVLAAALAGCGGEAGGDERGTATLWVTRDRGAIVLFTGRVPAGLSVLEALDRNLDVDTRYGGRYVQAIEGVEGSLADRRDWFYFVNGYESDVGATEYTLRRGDVAWWDFRSWERSLRQPVVVGAFPEPFLHGFGGDRRPAVVRYATPAQAAAARLLATVIDARSVASASTAAPADVNVLRLVTGRARFLARLRDSDAAPGAPVEFVLAGDVMRLAREPRLARYRYAGLP